MHICFISPCQFNEFTGGIDRVCCQLIREFSKVGLRLSSAFLHKSIDAGIDGVSHYLLPCPNDAAAPQNVQFLRELIVTKSIDIVWLNTYVQGQFACAKLAVAGTSAKLVYTFHCDPVAPLVDLSDGLDYQKTRFTYDRTGCCLWTYLRGVLKFPLGYYFRRRHLQRFYRDIVENCDLVTFLSDGSKNDFALLAGNAHARLCVVRNPVDITVDYASAKKKQVLFVGRLVWQKRVDRLLKAWSKLQNKFPEWKLVIVGDGPDKSLFHQIADRLKLERVCFEGSRPSLGYYKDAAVVCVPSSHEGFSLVALESIANGCVPVFYDSIHSLVELLGCETAAKSWSVDCLVKSLSATMLRFEKNKHSLVNGIEVLNELTPEKIANKYIKEFQKLIR